MNKAKSRPPLLVPERRRAITELVEQKGSVRVAALSSMFGVTEETIRRDLEELEQDGLLKRTYGGAVAVGGRGSSLELPFARRQAAQREEKRRIGAAAASLLSDGETIALDASTTALEIVRHLHGIQNLTVLTNSVHVVLELAQRRDVRVICTGGSLRDASLSFVGPLADRALASYHVDKVFLSGKGFSADKGLTDSNELEVELKKRMAEAAGEVIAVLDSSKFGYIGFCQILPPERIDKVVSDAAPPPEIRERIEEIGLEWIVAE